MRPAEAEASSPGSVPATTVRLASGRSLRYREFGARQGFPVLALHGLPGSSWKFSGTGAAATALGLRVLAPDRWGYGGTQPHPAPSLAAFAGDMTELVDRLGLGRLAVLGVSGGAPYAAAVAAIMAGRIAAAALVSPVGPVARADGADGLSAFHRLCFRILPHAPGVLPAAFHLFRLACRRAGPLACRITTLRAPAVDRATLRRADVGPRLAATFREGLEPGVAGPVTDMALFARPWNVPLDRISAATRVWIGSLDTSVPVAAARLLARRIPGADCTLLDSAGHLWLALNYAHVLGWIDTERRRLSA